MQKWKDFVYGWARGAWVHPPMTEYGLRLTLVYLCDESPADIDNIIKPIQDALVGAVMGDDSQVTDVDSHRRFLTDTFDLTSLPLLLLKGVLSGQECVYVSVSVAGALESYL